VKLQQDGNGHHDGCYGGGNGAFSGQLEIPVAKKRSEKPISTVMAVMMPGDIQWEAGPLGATEASGLRT